MKNNFLNNNGVSLLNTKKSPKTKVEVQIEMLKNQEQAIITELSSWETKKPKAERLNNYFYEVNKFSTIFLDEAVEKEKKQERPDNWAWEYSLKNKIEFALKFKPAKEVFYQLVFQKIENPKLVI